MIRTYKVKLKPNNKQKDALLRQLGAARFAYNWALTETKKFYKINKKLISQKDLRKKFTEFKHFKKNIWLNQISVDVVKQSIIDLYTAYSNFFHKHCNLPKYKKKRDNHQSFYIDVYKIRFSENSVFIPTLLSKSKKHSKKNWVKLSEKNRIPILADHSYFNPRIVFDGINFWITVGIDKAFNNSSIKYNDGIGIDLGLKTFAVTSDQHLYANFNKSKSILTIDRRIRKMQRSISKKYMLNNNKGKYQKTESIKKLEIKVKQANRKLCEIKKSYLYSIILDIINRNPKFIVLEDLNIKGMIKNKYLSHSIQSACFYKFREILKYKAEEKGIQLIFADRFYPSSKICSHCGEKKDKLHLSERTFICDHCGSHIDRDLNASINLKKYGDNIISK